MHRSHRTGSLGRAPSGRNSPALHPCNSISSSFRVSACFCTHVPACSHITQANNVCCHSFRSSQPLKQVVNTSAAPSSLGAVCLPHYFVSGRSRGLSRTCAVCFHAGRKRQITEQNGPLWEAARCVFSSDG